ncbi:MAG: hypothetical protein DME16_20470 [Candidatus Rokuibacteriota bacterium]|nr:MAG: hypothetical protein DME16_20470 [Candidatus Rokubacteria bacterium]
MRLRLATLGSFGKWAVRRDKLVRNPRDQLTRPRRRSQVPAVPSWKTVQALLQQCTSRERAILTLMAHGGLRRGEVVALDVGDVALDFGLRRVKGKGGHEVPVVLPAPARAILREYLATERAGAAATAPLFVVTYERQSGQRVERRISGQRLWKLVKAVGMRAGIPALHPHAFRHACAVELNVEQRICGSCKNTYGTKTSRRRRATPGLRSRTSSRRWKRSTTTGSENRIHIPPPRETKLRGENRHRIAVVAPTGFEPVFQP